MASIKGGPEGDRAKEVQQFIEEVTGESFSSDFHESLKSGVLLCKTLNKIQPGTVPKIQTSNMPFKQMENIAAYIEGSRKLGVPDEYNFMTVDLFEGKNLAQVAQNVIALKRARGLGFNKSSSKTSSSSMETSSSVSTSVDQTTESKSQDAFIAREPQVVISDSEVSRTGPGKISGRHTNTSAMNCPVCTKFITGGSVNALGKSWHPNCFVCKKCNTKLSTLKYYEHEDWPYCERCILIVKPQSNVKTATKDMKGFKFS